MQTGETAAVNSLYFTQKIVYLFSAYRNYLFEKYILSAGLEWQDRGGVSVPGAIDRAFALSLRNLWRLRPTEEKVWADMGVPSPSLSCDQGPGTVPL